MAKEGRVSERRASGLATRDLGAKRNAIARAVGGRCEHGEALCSEEVGDTMRCAMPSDARAITGCQAKDELRLKGGDDGGVLAGVECSGCSEADAGEGEGRGQRRERKRRGGDGGRGWSSSDARTREWERGRAEVSVRVENKIQPYHKTASRGPPGDGEEV